MFKLNSTCKILTATFIFLSATSVFISCSSEDETPISQDFHTNDTMADSDTIYIDTETPEIRKADINSCSMQTQVLISSFESHTARSTNELDVFYFYDPLTDRSAYAIEHPTMSNTWIYECRSNNNGECTNIIFQQLSDNKFAVINEEGEELRTFSFNPETNELWTYNRISRRQLSSQDSFLCGTAFTAACYLVGEAFAVPSGGASLALSMGFFVASYYICD